MYFYYMCFCANLDADERLNMTKLPPFFYYLHSAQAALEEVHLHNSSPGGNTSVKLLRLQLVHDCLSTSTNKHLSSWLGVKWKRSCCV